MKLVIGGCSQGKLDYILNQNRLTNAFVLEGEFFGEGKLYELIDKGQIIVMNHFHLWIRNSMLHGENPEQEILEFVNKNPDSIIISDEIGNGIVPIDRFEREYREQTGMILVKLAEQADEVVRVICGIGQKIK